MFQSNQDAGVTRWAVVRLGVGSRTSVITLASRFFPLTTHWIKCTVPCPGDECALCELLPGRGQFYLPVACNGRVSLLELGSQSASHFEQHVRLMGGGMRPGICVDLTRRSPKSPVYSEVSGFKEGIQEIELLDIAAHVMALYRFPCPNPGENLAAYERRLKAMSQLRNKRLRDQLTVAKK